MSYTEIFTQERMTAGDLVAELTSLAPEPGANKTEWPGLTTYRFEAPMTPQWDDVGSMSLCFVAQGRKRVVTEGQDLIYDPFHYLVFTRGQRFQAEILTAGPDVPFLSFVLQIDPAVVRDVSRDMLERSATPFRRPTGAETVRDELAYISEVEAHLTGAVLRFLRSVAIPADRRILAPMFLQEITYRLLQAEQFARLLDAAAAEHETNPISGAINYIQAHISEPLSVGDLAEHVAMSPSAFSHLFREVVGTSPYQFIKGVRLDRARSMLVLEQQNVSEVARDVGYTSLSHFITEFKRHFGVTPRAYAASQRENLALNVREATRAP